MPIIQPCIEGQIIIGEYVIAECEHGGVWISRLDGEGGRFDADRLEAVIADFYEENF